MQLPPQRDSQPCRYSRRTLDSSSRDVNFGRSRNFVTQPSTVDSLTLRPFSNPSTSLPPPFCRAASHQSSSFISVHASEPDFAPLFRFAPSSPARIPSINSAAPSTASAPVPSRRVPTSSTRSQRFGRSVPPIGSVSAVTAAAALLNSVSPTRVQLVRHPSFLSSSGRAPISVLSWRLWTINPSSNSRASPLSTNPYGASCSTSSGRIVASFSTETGCS
jgi:hypothetical protein